MEGEDAEEDEVNVEDEANVEDDTELEEEEENLPALRETLVERSHREFLDAKAYADEIQVPTDSLKEEGTTRLCSLDSSMTR